MSITVHLTATRLKTGSCPENNAALRHVRVFFDPLGLLMTLVVLCSSYPLFALIGRQEATRADPEAEPKPNAQQPPTVQSLSDPKIQSKHDTQPPSSDQTTGADPSTKSHQPPQESSFHPVLSSSLCRPGTAAMLAPLHCNNSHSLLSQCCSLVSCHAQPWIKPSSSHVDTSFACRQVRRPSRMLLQIRFRRMCHRVCE